METDDLESMIANGVTDRFSLRDCDIAGVFIQCERGNLEAIVSSFTDTRKSLPDPSLGRFRYRLRISYNNGYRSIGSLV